MFAFTDIRNKIDQLDIKAESQPLSSDKVSSRISLVKSLPTIEHGLGYGSFNLSKSHLSIVSHEIQGIRSLRPTYSSSLFNQLSVDEVQLLDTPFSDVVIKDAVWDYGSDKAPGPDGFTFKFLKKHWNLLEYDIIDYVKDFEATAHIPKGCNSSFITLLPKVEDPIVIGRQIIDGPLIVDEIIAWAKKHKKRCMFLKVDFEKAFDTLSRSFLLSIMEQMGFSVKWRSWIHSCLNSAYASVLINGSPTKEFKLDRGLRQGDPLSPFLFIIAIEALNVTLLESTNNNIFHGIKVGKDKVHISHLQFTNDALIMGEWSLSNAKNLSRILTCFHLASGLRVNFNKSKLFGIGVTNVELNTIASSIGCLALQFPCIYLGLPIGAKMISCLNWNPLVERFLKRLSNWKAKTLSFGGRLTLIRSVLGSSGVYYFSTFKAPKKIICKLEGIRRRFFWGGSANEKKISWIAWDKVTSPRNMGGLGIGSLKTSNQSLLAKWWWRIRNEEHALWSKVIYLLHGPMGGLVEDSGSVIATTGPWSQIRKLKIHLNTIGINLPLLFKKKVGNRRNTSFWHDKWLGGSPLHVTYPRLYRLDLNPHCSVSDRNTYVPRVSSSEVSESSLVRGPSFGRRSRPTGPIINWSWSRPICSGHESSELAELMSILTHFNLSDEQDSWEFIIDPSRQFSVKAIRNHISILTSLLPPHPTHWNKMLPLKVNILLWRVMNRRILTRINLDMRGIDLDTLRCPVCDDDLESEDHIFAKCCITVDT
ncbi:putative RNA-directed DNA polymerase, eukaryota, reverse transcriptase zinc-binding domain protein [Tanacetum coccineum]